MIGDTRQFLLLTHLNVQNANALSSPFTIGFPAMTAWLGAVHALQRKLNTDGYTALKFDAVAVVSHECVLQTHKGVGDYVHSIIGTANPLDKTGARSAFIEEARCHLDISLVIECLGINKDDEELMMERVSHHLNCSMKMAGGDILKFDVPSMIRIEEGLDANLRGLTRKLMPGYAIVERRELMREAMEGGQDAIDGLLDFLMLHNTCDEDDDGNVTWTCKRKTSGWIVPIATGFQAISELAQAKNQRDENTEHRFAESVVTLGEFKMPHQIRSIDEILWRYHVEPENDLYLCQQSN